jgi:hypothetical protein
MTPEEIDRAHYKLLRQLGPRLTRNKYTIALDAHYDLFVADMPCEPDDVSDYEVAYELAADELANGLGITIKVVLIPGCGYESEQAFQCDDDEESNWIWQTIHNLTEK